MPRTPRNHALAFGLIVLVCPLFSAGCLQSSKISTSEPIDVNELSPKLNPFVFFEDGLLFLGADTRAAQYVKEGGIFPVGVGIANQSRGTLRFNAESFVLESSDGKRFPVVSHREFAEGYTRATTDLRLFDQFREAMTTRFLAYRPLSWNLFPARGGGGVTQPAVELGRNYWTMTYLYFPIPEEGIHGKEFTLLADPDGADETFLVRFRVR